MLTVTEEISSDELRNNQIYEKAHGILSSGGLVAFPTETVYGLGADAANPEACKRIYEAKGRPSDNPLIVHGWSTEAVMSVAEPDKRALLLAEHFWPGPLTLVLKHKGNVSDVVTGGRDTVAVRVPAHRTARRLLETCDMLVAAPSANLSGHPSPTHSRHVIGDLDGRVDMIIADDSVNVGVESTILDLSTDSPVILRPGVVTCEDIKEVLGEDVTFALEGADEGGPKAPGMKYRHYAPEAEMTVFTGDKNKQVSMISKMAEAAVSEGKRVFILAGSDTAARYAFGEVICLGADEEDAARALYSALRSCDDEGAQVILSEGFEEKGVGVALMNRLIKASGNNIISV